MPIPELNEDTAAGDIAAFTTNRFGPGAPDSMDKSSNFSILGGVDKDIKYLKSVEVKSKSKGKDKKKKKEKKD